MKSRDEAIEKLKELTEGIDFCMLTTVDAGQLRSRPMSTQELDEHGNLWFFTSEQTHKVEEIEKDDRVNAAYSKPEDDTFVSVSGRATVEKNRAKIEELWDPILKAWFPEGLDSPDLCLLKVDIESAEYWEAESGKLVEIAGFVKALVTGTSAEWGANEKIEL